MGSPMEGKRPQQANFPVTEFYCLRGPRASASFPTRFLKDAARMKEAARLSALQASARTARTVQRPFAAGCVRTHRGPVRPSPAIVDTLAVNPNERAVPVVSGVWPRGRRTRRPPPSPTAQAPGRATASRAAPVPLGPRASLWARLPATWMHEPTEAEGSVAKGAPSADQPLCRPDASAALYYSAWSNRNEINPLPR